MSVCLDRCEGNHTREQTSSSDGGFHIHIQSNFSDFRNTNVATGEVCIGTDNNEAATFGPGVVFNTTPGGATEYTSEGRGTVTCPGPNDNDWFHDIVHVTVDATATGNVSSSVSDMTFGCNR